MWYFFIKAAAYNVKIYVRGDIIIRIILIVKIVAVILFLAEPVWAVQAHGGAEGLVSHQIGHVLFIIGMGSLLFRLHNFKMTGPGWLEFKGFLWTILAWNLVTFSGHWMNEFIDKSKYIRSADHNVFFHITSIGDAYYYFTRLDHLILVPSMTFLLLALRKWRQQQ